MRTKLKQLDSTHPETSLERKVDHYVSLALGEGTDPWKHLCDSEKKLLAIGRLSQRDFALAPHSTAEAYERLWKELSGAAHLALIFRREG